jgi:hypothetical protein
MEGFVCEACIMEFGYQLIVFCKSEENHEKVDGVGRSQNLPDANWHLPACCPTFKYTNSEVSHYMFVVLLYFDISANFSDTVSFHVYALDE